MKPPLEKCRIGSTRCGRSLIKRTLAFSMLLLAFATNFAFAQRQKIKSEFDKDEWRAERAAVFYPKDQFTLAPTNPALQKSAPSAPDAILATTYQYSTSVASTAWLNTANWTGNAGHWPGVTTTVNASSGATDDIATFGSLAIGASTIGWNNTTAGGGLTLGAIQYLSSLNKALIIGISTANTGTLTLNGGTLNSVGNTILSNESSQNVTLQNNGGSASAVMNIGLGNATNNVIQINGTGNISITSVITGSGKNLTLQGTGSGSLTLGAANTFSGSFTASNTTTNLSVNNALQNVTSVSIASGATVRTPTTGLTNVINDSAAVTNNGTLDVSGGSETIGSLAGTNGSALLTIGKSGATSGSFTVGDSTNTSFAGVIQDGTAGTGTTTFTKQGSGTLTLTGTNTYSGSTAVTGGGTLLISNTSGSGTGTSNVTVNGSGTTLGGTGTITGTVTLGNTTPGAILNPGPSGTAGTAASVGTLTTGALTLTGANTFHVDAFGTATTAWDKLVSTAAIALGTTSTLDVAIASGLGFTANTVYVLLNGTSLTGTFSGITDGQTVTFNGYDFTADYTLTGFDLIAVPEPSTWIAGALVLIVIGYSQSGRLARLLRRGA